MSEDHNLVPARPIGNIYCGTCSWTDRTLIESGGFYAADIRSPAARLRYYAQVFPIVEVDATYYALPSEQNARLWVERTPPGFVLPGLTAAERFHYLYSEDELRGWVEPVRALAEQADQVHVLMNNCYRDYAVRNARQLAALLAQPRAESAPATPPASSQ